MVIARRYQLVTETPVNFSRYRRRFDIFRFGEPNQNMSNVRLYRLKLTVVSATNWYRLATTIPLIMLNFSCRTPRPMSMMASCHALESKPSVKLSPSIALVARRRPRTQSNTLPSWLDTPTLLILRVGVPKGSWHVQGKITHGNVTI